MAVLTMMRLTFLEAVRRRIALAAVLLGTAFLVLYAIALYFLVNRTGLPPADNPANILLRNQVFSFLGQAGMYAVNFLGIALGALVSADTLAGEIATGTVQALVTKPVRRAEIVLGKWLAYIIVVAGYLLGMAGGVLLVARVIGGVTPPNVLNGLPLMLTEVVVLVSVSIAGGTRLSTVTNGMMVFGLYGLAFIGHWVEQIGTHISNAAARNVGTVASLIMPAEALWQRAAWLMQPTIMRELQATPFSPASVPSPAMVWWAAGYSTAALLLAVRWFGRRGL